MKKKHSHVCFSWCDVLCDTLADQAMAEFTVVFSVLRGYAIHAFGTLVNNSTIVVDEGMVSVFIT